MNLDCVTHSLGWRMRTINPLTIDAIKSEIQEFITEGDLMSDVDYECIKKHSKWVVFRTPPIRNMFKHVARVLKQAKLGPPRDRFTDPIGGRYIHFSPAMVKEKKVLQFSSEFESGNLKYAGLTSEGDYMLAIRQDVGLETRKVVSSSPRFYFSFAVRNGPIKRKIRFKIINVNKNLALYASGMGIWVYSEHRIVGKRLWRHTCSDISIVEDSLYAELGDANVVETRFTLSFTYDFQVDHDCTSFAFNIPYTYSMLTHFLHEIKPDNAFCHKFALASTLCGLECPGLVITNPAVDIRTKKHVIVTARMHASEAASSWMVHGLIHQLLSEEDPTGKLLRDNCVFTIFPMMNPDGVVLGNTRFNSCGFDMNRQFHPNSAGRCAEILAFFKILNAIQISNDCMYLDFHGHARRRGFFYHLSAGDQSEANRFVEMTRDLVGSPADIGSNPRWFSLQHCTVNDTRSRTGSSIHTMRAQLKSVFAVTVEASCFSGKGPLGSSRIDETCSRILFVPSVLKSIGVTVGKMVLYQFAILKRPPPTTFVDDPLEPSDNASSDGGDGDRDIQAPTPPAEEPELVVSAEAAEEPESAMRILSGKPLVKKSPKPKPPRSYYMRSSQLEGAIPLTRAHSLRVRSPAVEFLPVLCGVPANVLMIGPIRHSQAHEV